MEGQKRQKADTNAKHVERVAELIATCSSAKTDIEPADKRTGAEVVRLQPAIPRPPRHRPLTKSIVQGSIIQRSLRHETQKSVRRSPKKDVQNRGKRGSRQDERLNRAAADSKLTGKQEN